jgi:peptidoglycan/LPS O-acetylase OafA/YrhL
MRIQQLDVLRAIAVLLVIGSHLPPTPPGAPGYVLASTDFLHHYGGLGVDLFFVLSGFLVSGLLFREYFADGEMHIGRFLARRALKIYPAFYVFLLVSIVLRLGYGDHLTTSQVLHEVLFIQNYGQGVWTHTWSLAVEEHFYLLLALLFWVFERSLRDRPRGAFRYLPVVFLATTATVAALRGWTSMTLTYSAQTHHFPTHLQIDSLLSGVVLCYYFHTHRELKIFVARHVPAAYALALAALVAANHIPTTVGQFVAGHVMTYIGFGMLVLASVCTTVNGRLTSRLSRGLAFVGAHSYSIYLWHTMVLVFGTIVTTKVLGREPGFYTAGVGYVFASVLVGVTMAKCVELPVLSLRDRWIPSRSHRGTFGPAPRASQPGVFAPVITVGTGTE